MCGRYARARESVDYVVRLGVDRETRWPMLDLDLPSWNVAPGTQQPVIYPSGLLRVRIGDTAQRGRRRKASRK
jgi:putative SOS response-associated peptidase YedK